MMATAQKNPATDRLILNLMETQPKFVRDTNQDMHPGAWTDVKACAWCPLSGPAIFMPEGVDPNKEGEEKRMKFYCVDFFGFREPGQDTPQQLYPH